MAGSAALVAGEVFAGEFRVERPLSEGGMGAVYIAEQLSTGKRRALKLMLPELVSDVRLRARFEQEARVGARIDSEHVIEVVGAGVDARTGAPWLAMELLDGADLTAWRSQNPRPSLLDVRGILAELCHAVGAAHAVGIVHRDLKPDNVFVAKSKRIGAPFMIKVLDFGIAKLVDEARSTKTAAVGTPLWMAPEQTEASSEVFPATDVWAIGLIAFWLLTGRVYWRGGNLETISVAVLLREVVLDPLVPASQRAHEYGALAALPQGFDAWFERAVARDPRARFANAKEAFAALDAIFSVSPALTTQPIASTQSMPATPPGFGHQPTYAGGAGAADPNRSSPAYVRVDPRSIPAPGYGASASPVHVAPYLQPAPAAPRKSGMGCLGWGLIIGLTSMVGCGACVGAALYVNDKNEKVCVNATLSDSERLEACKAVCNPTIDNEAEYCEAYGDLLTKDGQSSDALLPFDAACKFGRTTACDKAKQIRPE